MLLGGVGGGGALFVGEGGGGDSVVEGVVWGALIDMKGIKLVLVRCVCSEYGSWGGGRGQGVWCDPWGAVHMG